MKRRISRVVVAFVVWICATSISLQPAIAESIQPQGELIRNATSGQSLGNISNTNARSLLPFDDISNSYAKNEIIDLYNRNILKGTSARSFSPTKAITRAEFVTVLDRLLVIEPTASPVSPFIDVPKSAWYYGWIQAAVQLGLADGKTASTFSPTEPITRQEAAALISRALKQSGAASGAVLGFHDNSLIADWAITSVITVNKLGLMKGDNNGNFRPREPITRQETAVLIGRVLQNKRWAAELEAESKDLIYLGWQYGQTDVQYANNVLQSNVNTLSPRWYYLEKTGAVSDYTDKSLITWAKDNNKKIWAMVGNRSDQEATHQMLSNTAAINTSINQLIALVKKYDLDGLNIDFENVAPEDRAGLTTFITGLANKMHLLNAVLSIDVSPDKGTDWTEAFDYAALGKQVDYIIMMGYDEHYGGSKYPGSVASLPYVEMALNRLIEVVPSKKVILALPFYNRDWTLNKDGTVSTSSFISFTEQNRLLNTYSLSPRWEGTVAQYTVSFMKNGLRHKIWLEDGRSLAAKYKSAANKNVAGFAYWYMGGESPDVWTSISNAERFYNYSF